jgi:protein ImuB
MAIPSYDDLTPSIPDVHPRDTFDQVTRLVPGDGLVVAPQLLADPHAPGLFACLTGRHPAALMALARDFSPRIERHGDTCVMLDIAGLGRLLGDAEGIASELLRTMVERGIKGSIAVAPTQTAARLLALANMDVTVVTGDVAAAVAPLSIDVLALMSAEPSRLFDILRRWGIRTIGEFAALSPADVAARFGQTGVAMQRLARGRDDRPLIPDPDVPRFIETIELEWPIEELEPLSFVFARLLEPLSAALERADRAAAAIRLDLRLVDRSSHSRMLQLPAPIRDARVLRTLLLLDLESHPPSAAIDVVRIEVDPAPSRIVQFSLLERPTPSPETLATLTARLNALVGETRCGSAVLLDSHRPDAFEMQRFDPRLRQGYGGQAEPRTTDDGPRTTDVVLRRFRPAVAIRVTVEHGRPVRVAIDRKGMPGGTVTQCAGPWRTSGAWWDDGGLHWDRDEWDVSLSDGSICRLYRDRLTEHWFLEAVID